MVEMLIQIGREGSAETPNGARLLRGIVAQNPEIRDYLVGCTGPEWWYWIARGLALADLDALVKGLTLAEEALGCSGSSVSAVIWTYRVLEQRCGGSASAAIGSFLESEHPRNLDLLRATTDWILQRTHNQYAPFGSRNKGAKSLAEYQQLCRLEREQKRIRQEQQLMREEEQQRAALLRRQAREVASKEHAARSGQRRKERQRLIAELASLAPIARWERIAEADCPLDLYPVEWANEKDSVLGSLPKAVRVALLKRLHGRRTGPWRSLLDRLQALEGPPSW